MNVRAVNITTDQVHSRWGGANCKAGAALRPLATNWGHHTHMITLRSNKTGLSERRWLHASLVPRLDCQSAYNVKSRLLQPDKQFDDA
jgi:hypothetical protein